MTAGTLTQYWRKVIVVPMRYKYTDGVDSRGLPLTEECGHPESAAFFALEPEQVDGTPGRHFCRCDSYETAEALAEWFNEFITMRRKLEGAHA